MSIKALQYSLQSVKKLTSYLNSLDTLPVTNLEEEKIGVRKGFQFGFDQSTGIFTIRVLTDFLCRTETPEPVKLFGGTIQCEYFFVDYREIIKKTDENQVDIPDDLLITLMSVSFSSARGMLAALTAGTDYQNIFLPLVNPREFKTMLKTVENKPETK
jgi:hypothetical protein